MNKAAKINKYDFLAPVILFFILYGLLELIVGLFAIPRWILPTPTKIFGTFFSSFENAILPNLTMTLQEILIGFVIGVPTGVIVAAFMTQFKILDKAFSPYVILLVTTPLLTLVPLLMLWLGVGMEVRVIAVIIQTFPIVMMNSATGFNNVDELKLELMKALGANRRQTFFRVVLPASLRHVFTGIKLGGIFATTTAISTEFVGGNVGLGSKIVTATSFIQTEVAFACILAVALIGVLLYAAISYVEKRIITWNI